MVAIRSVRCEPDIAHPTCDEVRGYLRKLLGRAEFNASDRNKRFLTYVVEETLGGRADRIKAYNIALAAFDRSEDFDPLIDPIVRIEASRLRRSLEHYYLTAGMLDTIRIDIPKGSYVATFAYRDHAPSEPEQAPKSGAPPSASTVSRPVIAFERRARKFWIPALAVLIALAGDVAVDHAWLYRNHGQAAEQADKLSIAVVTFENTSGDPARAYIARGLTYELVAKLMQVDNVTVFSSDGGLGGGGENQAPAPSDLALFGSVQPAADRIRVTAILADTRTGQFLRSWNFEGELEQLSYANLQSEIAREIVLAIRRLCPEAGLGGSAAKTLTDAAISYDCSHQTYVAAN